MTSVMCYLTLYLYRYPLFFCAKHVVFGGGDIFFFALYILSIGGNAANLIFEKS